MNPGSGGKHSTRGLRLSSRRLGTVCTLAALLALALPCPLWACATCFGRSDDAMARGMNMGILSLLLVVGFVLGGLGAFGIFLARRAARFAPPAVANEPEASPGGLVDSLSQPTTK